jgi:hypothetical protein
MPSRIAAAVRIYLWVLGVGLLAEGATMLILGAVPADRLPPMPALFAPDPLRSMIHITWGLITVLLLSSGLNDFGTALLALVFGIFSIALGVLGVLADRPSGLPLGSGQNALHFIIGPTALLLGILGLLASQELFSPRAP